MLGSRARARPPLSNSPLPLSLKYVDPERSDDVTKVRILGFHIRGFVLSGSPIVKGSLWRPVDQW